MLNKITVLAAGLALATIAGQARAADPWAGGDAAAGKTTFTKCALCHSIEAGKTKIGPSLYGVVGRPVASVAGYSYSSAMKAHAEKVKAWTPEALFTYLEAPMKVVQGTKMAFPGLKAEADRKNVIAYLETLK